MALNIQIWNFTDKLKSRSSLSPQTTSDSLSEKFYPRVNEFKADNSFRFFF